MSKKFFMKKIITVLLFVPYLCIANESPLHHVAQNKMVDGMKIGLWVEESNDTTYFGAYANNAKSGLWMVYSDLKLVEILYYSNNNIIFNSVGENIFLETDTLFSVQNKAPGTGKYDGLKLLYRIKDIWQGSTILHFNYNIDESNSIHIVVNNLVIAATFFTCDGYVNGELLIFKDNFKHYSISYENGVCNGWAYSFNRDGKVKGSIFYCYGKYANCKHKRKFRSLIKNMPVRLGNKLTGYPKDYIVIPFENGLLLPNRFFQGYYGVLILGYELFM